MSKAFNYFCCFIIFASIVLVIVLNIFSYDKIAESKADEEYLQFVKAVIEKDGDPSYIELNIDRIYDEDTAILEFKNVRIYVEYKYKRYSWDEPGYTVRTYGKNNLAVIFPDADRSPKTIQYLIDKYNLQIGPEVKARKERERELREKAEEAETINYYLN